MRKGRKEGRRVGGGGKEGGRVGRGGKGWKEGMYKKEKKMYDR